MINHISESVLVKIWQQQLLDRTSLVTEDGEPLRVIYPGRINGDQGADLLDAVIGTSQGLVKGDIEVHVKSSNWQAHRHHMDPAYNGVILHVVFRRDSEVTTKLQNGETVPTLAIDKYMKVQGSDQGADSLGMPCHRAAGHLHRRLIAEFLDTAGEERFLAKAAEFQKDLELTEADQALYQGIMGALGYAKNKLPCLELARRLPLQALESAISGRASDEECLARQQALLLGTAGLLPSQRSGWHRTNRCDNWVEGLESVWASSRQTKAMSENDWQLFKVRPNNLPQRRIVAMSYLLLRYREKGILEELMNKLRELPADTGCELEKTVMVTADGYWANHLDFGLPSRRSVPSLIGNRRAADIVVNVLLPFAFAWGRLEPGLARKAVELYYHYPRLTANAMERHMKQQFGLDSRPVNSARRQQGLLHIYKTLCSQGKCEWCALGRRQLASVSSGT